MDNCVVLVEDDPPADDPDLLGLYDGTPLTERGQGYTMALPDRITIFRNPDAGDVRRARTRSSRRCGSPSCTRSRTTSASTTTGCTTSATPEPAPTAKPSAHSSSAGTTVSSDVQRPQPRGPRSWVCTAKEEYVVRPPQKPVPSSAIGVPGRGRAR